MKRILLPRHSLVVVLFLTVLSSCVQRREPVRRETTAMDAFLIVTVYDKGPEEQTVHSLIDSVFLEVRRIEQMATDYSPSSEIGRVNGVAGAETVAVSKEIRSIIEAAEHYSAMTDGAFDITVGPVVHRWDFLSESPVVPDSAEIAQMLPLVDFRRVSLTPRGLHLEEAGMGLDLGGIAKGYAVDRSIDILRRNGLKNCIIDLGGNLGVFWEGTRLLDSTRARISIRDPRNPGSMIAGFDVGTSGVSTSGDYQRYFISDGVRYHHVLDPGTGFPARDVVSVTIIAPDALTADVLSTSAFVLGRRKGLDLIESISGVEGIFFVEGPDSLAMIVSSGLAGRVDRAE